MNAKGVHCVNVNQDQEEARLGTMHTAPTTTMKGAKTGAESSASSVSTSASSPTISDFDQLKNNLDEAEKEVRFWSNKVKENFEDWEKESNSERGTKKKESLKEAKECLSGAKAERDRLSAQVQRLKTEIVAGTSCLNRIAIKEKESLEEAKECLNGAKAERDRLSAQIQRLKTEIVAGTSCLNRIAKKEKESLEEAKECLNDAKAERDRLSPQVQRLKAEIVAVTRTPLFRSDVPPSVDDLLQLDLPEFKLRDIDLSGGPPIGPDMQVDMRFFPGARPVAEKILRKIRTLNNNAHVMLIAVSGAGKTSAIFQVAQQIFTLYIPYTSDAIRAQPIRYARDKTELFAEHEAANNRTVPFKLTAAENTEEAKRLSLIFLVIHYFLLLLFLKRFPSATPIQFLLFQLTTGEWNDRVTRVFPRLQQLSLIGAEELACDIRRHMIPLLAVSDSRVLLAIDEIEHATLLSPFLRATRDFLDVIPMAMLLSGTGYDQGRYTGGISKAEVPRFMASDFPLATKEDVARILGTLSGITKEMVDELANLDYLVNARFGLVARSVEIFRQRTEELSPDIRLLESIDSSVEHHKQKLMERTEELGAISHLKASIDSSVEQHKQKLMDSIQEQLDSVSPEKKSHLLTLLHAIYVGSKLSNGRMEFTTWDIDLCRIGLGEAIKKNVFRISELFALDVIEAFFESNHDSDESISFAQSLQDLQTVIRACGATVTAKNELFENVVFQAFRRTCFQGKPVSKLGFVSKLESTKEEKRKEKEWSDVIFKCNAVQTLPIEGSDSQFVQKNPYVMLSPQEDHRADGIMYMRADERPNQKHLVQLGIKFHSSRVPADKVKSQFRATDPNKAYGHARMDIPVAANAERRAEWDELGFNKMKALRVHVNIPQGDVPGWNRYNPLDEHVYFPGTYLMEDGSLVVNIDKSNLDLLFGNPENDEEKDTRDALYRLLAVVNRR